MMHHIFAVAPIHLRDSEQSAAAVTTFYAAGAADAGSKSLVHC